MILSMNDYLLEAIDESGLEISRTAAVPGCPDECFSMLIPRLTN